MWRVGGTVPRRYDHCEGETMAETPTTPDQDLEKGAVEGPPNENAQGNANAPGLNEEGLPNDEVAIAQDVVGANADETEG
jgi:hypothetical protein